MPYFTILFFCFKETISKSFLHVADSIQYIKKKFADLPWQATVQHKDCLPKPHLPDN